MKTKSVVAHKQRLDNLFKMIDALPASGDMELRSHWARYLCVLTSGFVEASVRAILADHAKARASKEVQNYVQSKLGDFQNAKMEKILALVQAFDKQWEERLRAATEGELKDAVDSIVVTRHNIAHGGDAGITYITVRNYYARAVKMLELLESYCVP